MGRYNAVYTLLWKKDAKGVFFVQDQYTLESRKKALRRVRGDDRTFASESAKISIPGTGSNLIATADREGTLYAYVSIRQHTSAYVSIRSNLISSPLPTVKVPYIRQHTYISQDTSAYVSIRQHTPAYVSIRQHTSAYGRISSPMLHMCRHTVIHVSSYYKSAYVSIRQHTSAYVSIRQHTVVSHRQCYVGVVILPYMCPHTTVCVSSYYYVCVLILLHRCRHTPIHVSSYYCMCVLILLCMCPHTTT